MFNEEDFEDGADFVDDNAAAILPARQYASAVGLRICLIKNDGMLEVTFEGSDGATAQWKFCGLEVENGSPMTASASTQTDTDPKRCLLCGVKPAISLGENNEARRTRKQEDREFDARAYEKLFKISWSRTEAKVDVLPDRPTPSSTRMGQVDKQLSLSNTSNSEEHSTGSGAKRKVQASPDVSPPLHKRAKSTHDSPSWPPHLYVTCSRGLPSFKGQIGTLHIDVQEGSMWFEGWYGKEHMRKFERKQVDLRNPTSKLVEILFLF